MRFRRASDVVGDVLDGHAVLLDPDAAKMLTLNPVGTLVWRHLDGDRTCAELVTLLLPNLQGVTAEQLEDDIAAFLRELVDAGVVITSDESA